MDLALLLPEVMAESAALDWASVAVVWASAAVLVLPEVSRRERVARRPCKVARPPWDPAVSVPATPLVLRRRLELPVFNRSSLVVRSDRGGS